MFSLWSWRKIIGSSVKPCAYPQILATLNRKNFILVIPISEDLNALILALKDSAEAFVERLMKKFIHFLDHTKAQKLVENTKLFNTYFIY